MTDRQAALEALEAGHLYLRSGCRRAGSNLPGDVGFGGDHPCPVGNDAGDH